MSNRTRTFRGTYTSNDKKVYHLNVRVFSRLAVFGLAVALIHSSLPHTNDESMGESPSRAEFGIEADSEDLALIESIIKDNPNILKDVTQSNYTVKDGESVSSIADACGISINRLCYLNDIKPDDTLYPGGTIKVENITAKSPNDAHIASLESYFYDYVFKSPVAQLATSNDEEHANQVNFYKSIIYGSPKSEADVDPISLFGRYINLYLSFHDNRESLNEDEKGRYIAELESLREDTERELNLAGTANTIIAFSQYENYLKMGTTKDKKTEPTY